MIGFLALLLAAASSPDDIAGPTRGLYLQLIRQARTDGRPRAAIAYLDDFDRQYPGDPDAHILRINSLLDLGDVDGAERAASTLPNDKGSSAIRGHILSARGLWDDAASFYRSAVANSPADPLLRNALGYALLRAAMADQAVDTLRAAHDLAPGDRVIRNNLLLALTVAGRSAEVEAALRQIRDEREQSALRRHLTAEAARMTARKGS